MEETKLVSLFADETIDDLQRSGMRLIQPAYGFRFGEDSVILAAVAAAECPFGAKKIRIAELGAGSGVVSFLMSARKPDMDFSLFELDPHRFDCLERNIKINGLEQSFTPYNIDIKLLFDKDKKHTISQEKLENYDMVVLNPPYRVPTVDDINGQEKIATRTTNTATSESKLLATEETGITLEDFAATAARMLKHKGKLVIIHRPHRLPDLMAALEYTGLEPMSLQIVESFPGKFPSRLILVARKGVKRGGFHWLAPLQMYERPGQMTAAAQALYGNEKRLDQTELLAGIKCKKEKWLPKSQKRTIKRDAQQLHRINETAVCSRDLTEPAGRLSLVATPIGNLDDITIRAVQVLKTVDLIACEDTRVTAALLKHYKINKPLESYHEHNKAAKGAKLVRLIKEGYKIALVADAGMPSISDPGLDLVHLCLQEGIRLDVLPGANAALTALVASGLDSSSFVFAGFLPPTKKERTYELSRLKTELRTVVLYEAPHRLLRTLYDLADYLEAGRSLVIARELTKKYEQWLHLTLESAITYFAQKQPKGEFVLVLEGAAAYLDRCPPDKNEQEQQVKEELLTLQKQGLTLKDAVNELAKTGLMRKNEIYKLAIDLQTEIDSV